MSHALLLSLALLPVVAAACFSAEPPVPDVVLAIHGGTAGGKTGLTPEREKAVRADMQRALEAGYAILQQPDGTALDAVEAAVRVLEDSPEFNAGKGAIFTHEGANELDASIMDGRTAQSGAVASVTVIKNPITAARAVMEKTPHVLLGGRGAEVFAAKAGLETVDPAYFWTKRRWEQIEKVWKQERAAESQAGASRKTAGDGPWGTVGAIARDAQGNLAAATSTGGLTNKMYGRIGDSPIIGAGTYAENGVCAVSGTGQGEYFIRYVVAHDIAALVKYKQLPIETAAAEVIGRLTTAGGDGGVIVLDAQGRFTSPYNTPGLYRGYVSRDGRTSIRLYDE